MREKGVIRRFLMDGYPSVIGDLVEVSLIYQIYVSTEPEHRLRCKMYEDGRVEYTEKIVNIQGGKEDVTINELSKEQFHYEMQRFGLHPIKKECRRYKLRSGNTIEVSRIDEQVYLGVMEFDTIDKANKWNVCDGLDGYVVGDVTHDDTYKMCNYWINTRMCGYGL